MIVIVMARPYNYTCCIKIDFMGKMMQDPARRMASTAFPDPKNHIDAQRWSDATLHLFMQSVHVSSFILHVYHIDPAVLIMVRETPASIRFSRVIS
jgi:hypothetical protein